MGIKPRAPRPTPAIFAVLTLVVGTIAWLSPAAGAAGPGNPFTWGSNDSGQLGDGSFSDHFLPEELDLDGVVDLHGGREHVIALLGDGTVRTWGRNNQGQLGDGTLSNRNSPLEVTGLSDIVAVSTGHYHSLALRDDGTVWTWGYNAFGQLGDGTTTRRTSPVQVSGLTNVTQIAAGRDMSYAIRGDGTLWGWGLNSSGQLGDGTTVQRTTPVRVGSLTGVVAVTGGRDHGLAVVSSGAVWGWGDNNYGQVGDGSTTDRTSPVSIGLAGAVDVIAGAHHSFALLGNGGVRSWGRNYRSQLGDGTGSQRTSPVAVQGITNAVAIGSGRDHGIAILADGTARAWGHNNGGELGDGTTIERSTPVTVQGLLGAEIVAGGSDYSVALVSSGTPPANQAPTAAFGFSCNLLECDFNSSASFDPDGSITSRSWEFGDGSGGSGVSPSHVYSEAGTYTVTLTVVDDEGAPDSVDHTVTVSDVVSDIAFRAAASSNQNSVSNSVTVPGSVQSGDTLVMFVTTNRNTTITNPPSGWALLGTELDGSPDMESYLYTRTAPPGYGGAQVSLTLAARAKTNIVLLAYSGSSGVTAWDGQPETGNGANHETPAIGVSGAGATIISYWSEKISSPTSWSLPATVTPRNQNNGSGGGRINSIVGDTASVPAGTWPGVIAGSSTGSSKALMWSVVLGGSGAPPGNQDPEASFTHTCDLLACNFDASASDDPDGTITGYEWDFGDGGAGTGETTAHNYAGSGLYTVELVVTDEEGATDSVTAQVSVSDGASSIAFRGADEFNANIQVSSVTVPDEVQAGDLLVLIATANKDVGLSGIPAGWSLLGTEQDGSPDMTSYLFTRSASAGLAGSEVSVTLAERAKTSLILLAYADAGAVTEFASAASPGSSSSHDAPDVNVTADGSVVVVYWADKTSGHGGWTAPAGVNPRAESSGSGSGQINALAGETLPLAPGTWNGVTATSGTSASKAISWAVVISPQ